MVNLSTNSLKLITYKGKMRTNNTIKLILNKPYVPIKPAGIGTHKIKLILNLKFIEKPKTLGYESVYFNFLHYLRIPQ